MPVLSNFVLFEHDLVRKPVPTFRDHALIDQFDLLGGFGGDDRAAAPFDPAAHPDTAAFQPLRLEAGRGKCALLAFKNDDGEIARPAPPEVDIYSGPALAHRQDLALDQREMTLFSL